MIPDRTQAPSFRPVGSIHLPDVTESTLTNGIPVVAAGYSGQEIVKLELVFSGGSMYSGFQGLNSLFAKMLLGGTDRKNSTQIIEGFDRFGGFAEISQSLEHLTVTLHGLRRFLPYYLETLTEILNESSFPEDELETQKKISVQTLKLSLEKPVYLAQVAFRKAVYGASHPFGREVAENDILALTSEVLRAFYQNRIKDKPFRVFVSGKVEESDIEILNEFLGRKELSTVGPGNLPEAAYVPARVIIEKSQNMQSTLRIGKPLVGRKHPDFFKTLVTNTAFGGYFGSRLMKNIREDKGFTYGISSSVNPLGNGGYWVMGSDVVKENTVETLQEISKELDLLKTEQISDNELETVKNYMCGSFAGSLTTPFEVMDRYKNLKLYDLPADYYDLFTERIRAVSAEDIQQVANHYFDESTFTEVIVGERI